MSALSSLFSQMVRELPASGRAAALALSTAASERALLKAEAEKREAEYQAEQAKDARYEEAWKNLEGALDGKPQELESFYDAVRGDPDMTPEAKAKWLATEPAT